MKQCLGPCVLEVNRQSYLNIVDNATLFLKGQNKEVEEKLAQNMRLAADQENFEAAALIRDQLFALQHINEKQHVVTQEIEQADFFGVYTEEGEISISVLVLRDFKIINQEDFSFTMVDVDKHDNIRHFIMQYYYTRFVPKTIFIDLDGDFRKDLQIVIPDKPNVLEGNRGEAANLTKMAKLNAKLSQQKSQEFASIQKGELKALAKFLGLSTPPKRIECIDISNLGGQANVAGIATFIEGRPSRENYRLYHLDRPNDKADDFASMAEALTRRLKRKNSEDSMADVIVLDGGKPQLQAALKACSGLLEDLPNPPLVVALAKKRKQGETERGPILSDERVVFPDKEYPKILKPGTPEYRVLTHLRDETHNHAIKGHRRKRGKIAFNSTLDDLPGIGPARRTALIKYFGGIDPLKQASRKEIAKVKGISEAMADKIYDFLHSSEADN